MCTSVRLKTTSARTLLAAPSAMRAMEAHVDDAEHGVVGVAGRRGAPSASASRSARSSRCFSVAWIAASSATGGSISSRACKRLRMRLGAQRPGIGVGQHQPRLGAADVDARAVADVEIAGHLQQPQRLAHRRRRHREALGQVLDAGQSVPRPAVLPPGSATAPPGSGGSRARWARRIARRHSRRFPPFD